MKNPKLKVVLFSAIMANPEELAAWLGSPENYVKASWRPTRQLKGLLVKESNSVNRERFREVKPRRGGRWVRYSPEEHTGQALPTRITVRETFSLGLALARDKSDLLEPNLTHLSLPSLITTTTTTHYRPGKTEVDRRSSTDLAVQLALTLRSLASRQLLFFMVPDSAEKAARELTARLPPMRRESHLKRSRERLAQALATLLGPDAPLVHCVRAGVAYHHSGMPDVAKRMVEVAAKNGTLRIICATSTLAEGLNMPVEMVMIVGGKHFSDDGNRARRVDMPASSFENIAGRAGRAFVSTEGLVVFVPEDYDIVDPEN